MLMEAMFLRVWRLGLSGVAALERSLLGLHRGRGALGHHYICLALFVVGMGSSVYMHFAPKGGCGLSLALLFGSQAVLFLFCALLVRF